MSHLHTIRPARRGDLDDLVWLQSQLFVQDAGVHGTYVDLDWPARSGLVDLSDLLENDDSLVLIACTAESSGHSADHGSPRALGFLVGYLSKPTPTRLPVNFAVLRSLFVESTKRGHGVGSGLCRYFIQWAEDKGCVEAQVSAYVTNDGAQRFYERHGFAAQSVQRSRPLPVAPL